jgi:hypothetical protein
VISSILEEDYENPQWTLYTNVLGDPNAWRISENEPVYFYEEARFQTRHGDVKRCASLWLYKNRIFEEGHGNDYTLEQRKLLVLEEFDKERIQFEKLHAKFSGLSSASQARSKIPSHVRIYVWQRDGGRCVECSSNENLEYDHIIPFAKGGANTERNLQLLCGACNRLKSANIQ